MDMPTYPPAAAFEQPVAPAYVLKLADFSLAELHAIPAAWEIVVKQLPIARMMIDSVNNQPHMSNFTIQSLQAFIGTVKPEIISAVDQELAKLPPVQGYTP